MVDFDPKKEAINLSKHHVSLARWVDLEIRAIVADDRFDYGEPRFRAYGHIDGDAHCLVFTIRDGGYRPISLRRAHAKEMRRHAP
ncbi:BrnT family toxin [Tardiphaga sp. vice352]|uniref:BrnT family toxin n=1 Tax=unclassified Tardiphaga TaxID=2631404 RepID=UPI001163C75F|nr:MULTISPECIES: BrnT family toxin [unclassified Tardiphaga]QDM16949.1 BrnT family toxin [Tardiphaga sp. vice278]QDM21931.1 BrnT family toxin [Tardiphaga sp. vice154]QDM27185.1 BrnT family toxin [Tardiphaga sp. vice304]QDM32310.1 BrnT family toxin [Tardiphaga sp. vice352]